MNEEQLIATLQACYFGDRGAFNKILKEYKQIQQENKELKEIHYLIQGGRGNGKTYLTKLQQENHQLKDRIEKAINDIDLVIELIKQQPTEDDSWILGRLNAFKIILKEVE